MVGARHGSRTALTEARKVTRHATWHGIMLPVSPTSDTLGGRPAPSDPPPAPLSPDADAMLAAFFTRYPGIDPDSVLGAVDVGHALRLRHQGDLGESAFADLLACAYAYDGQPDDPTRYYTRRALLRALLACEAIGDESELYRFSMALDRSVACGGITWAPVEIGPGQLTWRPMSLAERQAAQAEVP